MHIVESAILTNAREYWVLVSVVGRLNIRLKIVLNGPNRRELWLKIWPKTKEWVSYLREAETKIGLQMLLHQEQIELRLNNLPLFMPLRVVKK